VEGLRVRLRRLGQARQRLALGLGDQAQLEAGELLKLPDIGKHRLVVGAVVVDEGHGRGRFAGFGHGGVSFLLDEVTTVPCRLYAHFDRTGITS